MKTLSKHTKAYVLELIKDVLDEDNEDFDFLVAHAATKASREVMYNDYIKTCSKWFVYLKLAIHNEEFEMAEDIRKVLMTEQDNYQYTIHKFCDWYSASDPNDIKDIQKELRLLYEI